MIERSLRRKLTFHAHNRTLVLVKRPSEKLEHRLMMALLWALYLPQYPDVRVEVAIGTRYKPDLVALDAHGQPRFWAEAGEVSLDKLRVLCGRYRATHLVFAKWNMNIMPFAGLLERALHDTRRTAPVELICFDEHAGHFVDNTGHIRIAFADVERKTWAYRSHERV